MTFQTHETHELLEMARDGRLERYLMQTAKLIIQGENGKEVHEIVKFSMLEPSTCHARFETREGAILRTYGCVLSYEGDIDALPPCPPTIKANV